MFTKEVSISVFNKTSNENFSILNNFYFISLLESMFKDTQLIIDILDNVKYLRIYEDKINSNLNKLIFNIDLKVKEQVNFFYNVIKNKLDKHKLRFFIISDNFSLINKNNFMSDVVIPMTIIKNININVFMNKLISIVLNHKNLKEDTLYFNINFKTYFMNLDKKQHFIKLNIIRYPPSLDFMYVISITLINKLLYKNKENKDKLEVIKFNLIRYDDNNIIKNEVNIEYNNNNNYLYKIIYNEYTKFIKLTIFKDNNKINEFFIQNIDIKDNLYKLLKYILSYGIQSEKYINTSKFNIIEKLFNKLIEEVYICVMI